ncbi:MAG: sugar phosphate isomerase/epimerase [Candidatus Levybacteria bacterium]|nr:sugar phosphate isomerase/epimerase [Candidatus Levybacteria bacterium]
MSILFSVGSIKHTSIEEQIIFAKEAGFDGIDYLQQFQDIFVIPRHILALTKKHKIRIKAVHIPLPLVLFTPFFLQQRVIESLKHFPHMELFNIHLSSLRNPFQRNIQNIENFFHLAKKHRIKISCESNSNEYLIPDYYPKETYDPKTFAAFCKQHNIPMTVDVSHIASWKENIVDFFQKNAANISLFHLSDMTHRNHHQPFGKGNLPLKELFKEMKRMKYKGMIVFEIFHFPKHNNKQEILADIKKSLSMFKKYAI